MSDSKIELIFEINFLFHYYLSELAEAARKERDIILNKKIEAEKVHLDSWKQNRKEETKPVFTFDMLETDDSTDDEDTVSKNRPHRPAPPAWSLSKSI